jgi:hypothetical protein
MPTMLKWRPILLPTANDMSVNEGAATDYLARGLSLNELPHSKQLYPPWLVLRTGPPHRVQRRDRPGPLRSPGMRGDGWS